MAVELRHLRYFLALAAERHFERAASQVGISQSALSQQIRKFEEELGFVLFTRSTQGVTITPAGEAMIPDARAALDRAERAVASARRAARGQTGRLGIAFAGPLADHLLPAILHALRHDHADVEIELLEAPLPNPTELLHDERANVLITAQPLSDRAVLTRRLLTDRLVAVTPEHHARANCAEVDLESLREERWLAWHDRLPARCARHGFTPQIVATANSFDGLLTLVAAEAGIALIPSSATREQRAGIATIPVRDEHTTVIVAWREERRGALTDACLAAAERVAAQLAVQPSTPVGI